MTDSNRSYDENGYLEVLVSKGYGAGWSTWNEDSSINLATDKRIIDFVKSDVFKSQDVKATKEFFKTLGIGIRIHSENPEEDEDYDPQYEYAYGGGFFDCIIKKLEPGTLFHVREYDGNEYIEVFNPGEWERA